MTTENELATALGALAKLMLTSGGYQCVILVFNTEDARDKIGMWTNAPPAHVTTIISCLHETLRQTNN